MAITRKYDSLFRSLASSIPLTYMRALAYRESGMDPRAQAPGGGTGLMQITGIALKDFNQNNTKSYSRWHMVLPKANVEVAGWLLRRIINAYGKSPSKNLQENWGNPEFVKILTAGWNDGWVAVLRVDKYLRARGIPVTHDNVYRYASNAGVTRALQDDQKRLWQKKVAQTFYNEGGYERDSLLPGPVVAGVATPGAAVLLGAAALGFGIWRYYWR